MCKLKERWGRVFLISWSANFTQVCLIRLIIAGFPKGSGSVGSGVGVHCSWWCSLGRSGGSVCLMSGLSLCAGVEPKISSLIAACSYQLLDQFCEFFSPVWSLQFSSGWQSIWSICLWYGWSFHNMYISFCLHCSVVRAVVLKHFGFHLVCHSFFNN